MCTCYAALVNVEREKEWGGGGGGGGEGDKEREQLLFLSFVPDVLLFVFSDWSLRKETRKRKRRR